MAENNKEPRVFCVYKHETPDGKFYVGQAKGDPRLRWQGGKGYRYQKFGIEAISQFGWEGVKSYLYRPSGWQEVSDEIDLDSIYWLTQDEADFIENASILALDSVNHGWNARKGSERIVTSDPTFDEENVKTNLNLRVSKRDAARMKVFAMKHNTSVSRLVVAMFEELYGHINVEG